MVSKKRLKHENIVEADDLFSVDDYFNSINILEPEPLPRFTERLLQDYPDLAEMFLDIAVARNRYEEGNFLSVYTVKNSFLDFSLRIASQFTGSEHRAYLRWFIDIVQEEPKTIVDIGCDNGVLTCAYAERFSGSNVIGIDVCAEGIECATELAARLKLRNAHFYQASLDEYVATNNQNSSDLVTLTRVHEDLADNSDAFGKSIDHLLDSTKGRLVCFEALSASDFSSWLNLLSAAALVPEPEPSVIEFKFGGNDRLVNGMGCLMKRSTQM
jgi:2-polyprenyl-3-methyl-5-hydroxy-6-metoxy-1,4-benzoquinol methylase